MKIPSANFVWTEGIDQDTHGLKPVSYLFVIQTNAQIQLKNVSEYDQEIP